MSQNNRSQPLKNIKFNKKGWFGSNSPIIFGNKYVINMKARLLQSNDAGGIVFTVPPDEINSPAFVFYMTNKSSESNPAGLRFLQPNPGGSKIDLLISEPISIYEWHNIGFSRDGSKWKIWIDDNVKTLEQYVPDFPTKYAFLGGAQYFEDHGTGGSWYMADQMCITDIQVNGKDVTYDDYNPSGNVSTCSELYDIDSLVIGGKASLSCKDSCETKYLNHLSDKVGWANIKCCHSGAINPDICDIGSSNGINPIIGYQSIGDGNLQCIYGRDKISSLNQVYESVKKFGNNNPIQNAFCQTKVNTCPQEMIGGCSRYFSIGPDGNYCRKLFNDQTDSQKDIAIAGYCSRNNTIDCKCANRSNDPDYIRLKQGNPFPDSCWYIPCANQQRYLVPSEFHHNPDCPANICQIVFDISQAHNVDIDHLKADINCDFGGGKYPNHSPYLWYYIVGFVLVTILLIIYARK